MAVPGGRQLSASAYRTLGLSGSATQGQIDQAARKLRIWPDPKNIPPTAWDLKWLGPITRSKNDIEQALARLSEPATRVGERLMWFNGSDPKPWTAADSARVPAIAAPKSPPDLHDRALYRLHMATVRDPNLKDPSQWHDVILGLRQLSSSDEYLCWLVDQENNGDFDKRASLEEIAEALQRLPDSLTAGFIARAEAALENDDFVVAGRIVELLKGCGQSADKSLAQILDRAEDLLIHRCSRLHEDLERQIKWDRDAFTQERPHNQQVCRELATVFNESIEPVIEEWQTLAPGDQERAERIRLSAAKGQIALARAWGWSGRFVIAERTLRSALEKARGSTLEAAILEDLPDYTNRARAELVGYTGMGQRQRVVTTNPGVRPQPRPVAVGTTPARRSSGFSFSGGAGVSLGGGGLMVLILVIRLAFAGIGAAVRSNNSGSGSTRMPTRTLPNYSPNAPSTWAHARQRDQQEDDSSDSTTPANSPSPAHSPPSAAPQQPYTPQPSPGYNPPSRIMPSNAPLAPPRQMPAPYGGHGFGGRR